MTRRLLIICGGKDTAGVGWAMKSAFDAHGGAWECRLVRRADSVYDYPTDIVWRQRDRIAGRYVQKLVREADVIQVQETTGVLRHLRGWQRKPLIAMQLGTHFRRNPARVTRLVERMGGRVVVNSLELLSLAPRAPLLPWPIDIDLMRRLREEHRREPDGRIRIYHSPTDRAIKSTAAFIAATDRLKARYPHIDVEIVEGVPWMENLRRKASADIVFDQLMLGYGINAAEAWAMRIPVVVGLRSPAARDLFISHHGYFPYPDTTESILEARLEELIVSESARQSYGGVGNHFVRETHAQNVVVEHAKDRYERLLRRTRAAVA